MNDEYELYNKQLEYVESLYDKPKNIDLRDYLCPICFVFYKINSENLTKDHVPPQSLGGRKLVITCKKCNNDAGGQYEFHLKEALEYFINKKFPSDQKTYVEVEIGEGKKIRGYAKRTSETLLNLLVPNKVNNPNTIDLWNVKIDSGIKDFHVKPITKRKIEETKIIISLLKTAYLQVFWRFGYIPIYDSYFQPIRDQISNPNTIIYPLPLSYLNDEKFFVGSGVNLFVFNEVQFLVSSFKVQLRGVSKQFNIILPLMYSQNGIANDAAVIYYYIKKNLLGKKITGNTISCTERPVLAGKTEEVVDYLVKRLM